MPLDSSLKIVPCNESEYPEIWKFIVDHFLYDEHINTAIGYHEKDVKGFLNYLIYDGLKSGMSLKCINAETGELVGCRISSLKNPKVICFHHQLLNDRIGENYQEINIATSQSSIKISSSRIEPVYNVAHLVLSDSYTQTQP